MAVDQETRDWVDEMKSKGFTDDDLRPFLARAEQSEPLGAALKGSVTATKHFKTKMDLLAKQEADTARLAEANVALQQELVRWKTTEADPKVAKAEKLLTEQAALKARVAERARQLRDKYGIEDEDVKDLLDTTAEIREAAPAAAAVAGATITEEGKFVKAEDFNKVAISMPRIAARITKLGRQFDKLYAGTTKEFDPDAVLELAEKENLKLDDAFSKLYDVSAREAQLNEAGIQKRIEDEVVKRTAALEAKYAKNPAYGGTSVEPSMISKVLERYAKESGKNGEVQKAEGLSSIERVRQAARGTAPEEAITRYAGIARSGKMRELVEKYKQEGSQ